MPGAEGARGGDRQLEAGGYLELVEDPEDQRSKRVKMTDRGFAAGKVMRAAVTEVEGEFAEAYGQDALERLRVLLVGLNEVLADG